MIRVSSGDWSVRLFKMCLASAIVMVRSLMVRPAFFVCPGLLFLLLFYVCMCMDCFLYVKRARRVDSILNNFERCSRKFLSRKKFSVTSFKIAQNTIHLRITSSRSRTWKGLVTICLTQGGKLSDFSSRWPAVMIRMAGVG